ncbi:MAG: hypothetical protein ACTSRZ_20740 [Promethearchaeota archaeon]
MDIVIREKESTGKVPKEEDVVKSISDEWVRFLKPEQIKHLEPEQINCLTIEQLKNLDMDKILNLLLALKEKDRKKHEVSN